MASLKPLVAGGLVAAAMVAAMGTDVAQAGNPAHAVPASVRASAPAPVESVRSIVADLRQSLRVIATADTSQMTIFESAGLLKDMASAASAKAAGLPPIPNELEQAFTDGETAGFGAALDDLKAAENARSAKIQAVLPHLRDPAARAARLKAQLTEQQQALEGRLLQATLDRIANDPFLTEDEVQSSAAATLREDGVGVGFVGLTAYDLTRSMNLATSAKVAALVEVAEGLRMFEETEATSLAPTVQTEALERLADAGADHIAAERVLICRLAQEDSDNAAHFVKASRAAGMADATLANVRWILSGQPTPDRLHAARLAAERGAAATEAAVAESLRDLKEMSATSLR
jgi:hypothetical protein